MPYARPTFTGEGASGLSMMRKRTSSVDRPPIPIRISELGYGSATFGREELEADDDEACEGEQGDELRQVGGIPAADLARGGAEARHAHAVPAEEDTRSAGSAIPPPRPRCHATRWPGRTSSGKVLCSRVVPPCRCADQSRQGRHEGTSTPSARQRGVRARVRSRRRFPFPRAPALTREACYDPSGRGAAARLSVQRLAGAAGTGGRAPDARHGRPRPCSRDPCEGPRSGRHGERRLPLRRVWLRDRRACACCRRARCAAASSGSSARSRRSATRSASRPRGFRRSA